jgi:hypothetical protein
MSPRKNKTRQEPKGSLREMTELAQELNLTAIRDQIAGILDRAQRQAPSYTDFTLELLRTESNTRASRRLTRNLKRSGLTDVADNLDGECQGSCRLICDHAASA